MAACLEAGCHYLDLGGLYWMTGRQLELGAAVRGRRPAGPARHRLGPRQDQSDGAAGSRGSSAGAVDSIHVSAAGRDLDPPAGFSVPYALQTLLDELTMPPVVLRDGAAGGDRAAGSAGGAVEFGEPIGAAETIYTLHSELRTFGESFGCREASFRLSLSPDLLSTLRELTRGPRGGDPANRRAKRSRPPARRSRCIWWRRPAADGRSAFGPSPSRSKRWGLGGGIVSTAAPAAAAVRLLARGQDRGPRRAAPESAASSPRRCSRSSSSGVAGSRSRPGRRCGPEGRRSHRDQAGRVPGRADARRRARARRARPRDPDPAGGRGGERDLRLRTTRPRAPASCPPPRTCSARPTWS